MSESQHSGNYPSHTNPSSQGPPQVSAAAALAGASDSETSVNESAAAAAGTGSDSDWSRSSRQQLVAQLSEQSCFYTPAPETLQSYDQAQLTPQVARFAATPTSLQQPPFEPLCPYQPEVGYAGKLFPDAFNFYI